MCTTRYAKGNILYSFVFLSFCRDKILDVQMDKFEICPETWQKDKWSKCKSSTKTQSALLHIEKLRNAKRKSVFHVVRKRHIWNLLRISLTNFYSVEDSSTKHKSAKCTLDTRKLANLNLIATGWVERRPSLPASPRRKRGGLQAWRSARTLGGGPHRGL